MYNVIVTDISTGKPIDAATANFAFGDWQEIGWWIDDRGFNEPGKYRLTITFS